MAQRNTGQPQIIQTVSLPGDGQPWGQLNRYDTFSRYTIPDTDFDELINWIPLGLSVRQVPGNSTAIATLAASAIWISAQTLNLAQYIFCLCTNGHIYQVSLGGTITDVTGATSMGINSDITNWQGTTILFTDPAASKIYSWDGATFATVFTAQPAKQIAVFQSRLWMANNNTVTFTAGGTFNSLGGDSGSFIITDTTCAPPIQALYPTQGMLFIFGYNWVQALGNLQSIGNPAVLNFTLNTIETQIGTINRFSIIALGTNVFWASTQGIWMAQGTFPQKVSKQLDGFFQSLTLASSSFSVAFGYVYEIPCLLWQSRVSTDSTTTVFGLTMDGTEATASGSSMYPGKWFRTQIAGETFLTSTIDQTNGQQKVFATDGSGLHIYQMFSNTVASVTSTAGFKYLAFGSNAAYKTMYKLAFELMFVGSGSASFSVYDEQGNNLNLTNNTLSYSTAVVFLDSLGNPITWTATPNVTWSASNAPSWQWFESGIDDRGRRIGTTLVVTGSGTSLESMSMEFEIDKAKWGR